MKRTLPDWIPTMNRLAAALLALLIPTFPERGQCGDESHAQLSEPVMIAERAITKEAGTPATTLSLAFSPDGKLLVSGGRGAHALRFWNPSTLQQLGAAEAPDQVARFVLFSADGTKLLTFGQEVGGECAIWDTASRALLSHWKATGYVGVVAFSPDGKTVAIGRHTDNQQQKSLIELRDPATGAVVRVIEGKEQTIRCLAFSRDGRTFAAGMQPEFGQGNCHVAVWHTGSGSEIARFKCDAGRSIEALTFFCSNEKPARPKGMELFDTGNGNWLLVGAAPLACAQADDHLALGHGPCGPALLDLRTGTPLFSLLNSSGQEPIVATISPDGRTFAGLEPDGHIAIWTTDRAAALAAGKLPQLRCQLLLDRSEYLVGEEISWRCRLTNVSDRELPVYASAQSPQQSAVTLRLRQLGGTSPRSQEPRTPQQLAPPVPLAPGASIDLQFPAAGPDAILLGGGKVAHLDRFSTLDTLYVEYAPPDAGADGAIISQPVALLRDTGPAFSAPVYSDWIKSNDGLISVRIHLDSALFNCQSDLFIHGEIRNDSGRKISIRVPQDDLYSSLRLQGPRGNARVAGRPSRFARFVALEPGASTIVYGILNADRYPALKDAGAFSIYYRFNSFAGGSAPADLWSGSVSVPPIKFWRVTSLAQAPREALRPPSEASTAGSR